MEPPKEFTWNDLTVFRKTKRRKKIEDYTKNEKILHESREKQTLVAAERLRLDAFRKYSSAALIIQKAWKMYKFRTKGILKNARDAIRSKRLDAGELAWKRQIAACTIQLAWRKYARRKLLSSLKRTGSSVIKPYDPDILSLRQKYLMQQIYNEQLYAPYWHPILTSAPRPPWVEYQESPAALSFNFALEQYLQPLVNSLSTLDLSYQLFSKSNLDENKDNSHLAKMGTMDGITEQSLAYSYNMRN